MNEMLKELFWLGLSSMLDPEVQFRPEHKRNVRMIRNALQKSPEKVRQLNKSILRNSFLYGCLEFTKDEPIEHLIAGFGKRYGGGTDISAVYHLTGNETGVGVPRQFVKLISIIKNHADTSPSAETILFHNHPKDWFNAIHRMPLASTADRRFMVQKKFLEPFFLVRNVLSQGTMRFYVAERERVKEIRIPAREDVVAFLKWLNLGGGR